MKMDKNQQRNWYSELIGPQPNPTIWPFLFASTSKTFTIVFL